MKIKSDGTNFVLEEYNGKTLNIAVSSDNPEKEEIESSYAYKRAVSYASIEDQLDMRYSDEVNNTTTWRDHISAVKAQFPKI